MSNEQPVIDLKMSPADIAEALEWAGNPKLLIDGQVVAEVDHISATATGNVITVKYYLKS